MPNRKIGLPFDRIDKIFNIDGCRIHFVGVNGVSMYSLARLAMLSGAHVSGSDRDIGEHARSLASLGAEIHAGHSAEQINEGIDMVVYSSAISEDNIELIRARELEIPTLTRARFMGSLMMSYGKKIGVSGTHGKSTTTAMLDAIFTKAGKNQTTLAGEDIPGIDSPLRVGSNDYLIYEACEYKDAFQMFNPSIAVALNMEMDHVDYYKDEHQLRNSFAKALSRATDFVLLNEDDENLFKIKTKITSRVITFGTNEKCDYRYSISSFGDTSHTFSISKNGRRIGIFRLSVMGAFNVINACAAAIVALECGISVKVIEEALKQFSGVKRRLELVGMHLGRPVIYDYAHHPTEIRASINTVRLNYQDKVTVVFKPHTYTRTQHFWRQFRLALELADYIVITDIYPARENPIPGVTSENLVKAIGAKAVYARDVDVPEIVDLYTHGAIIVMGAGDLRDVKERLVKSNSEAED